MAMVVFQGFLMCAMWDLLFAHGREVVEPNQ